jgi:hypothetical protein
MAADNEPKTVGIERSHEDFFESLSKGASSLKAPTFDNKHRWLLALALGFRNHVRKKDMRRGTGGYFRTEQLDTNFDKPILRAVAVHEHKGDLNAISDWKEVYTIAEEYSAAGVTELKELMKSPGDFFKKLELMIADELEAFEKRRKK